MENFFDASKPFLKLSNFMGLFPMTLCDLKTGYTFKSRFIDIFKTFVWFILQFLLFIMIFVREKEHELSKILERVWKIVNILEFAFMIMNFCYQIIKRKNISNFLMKIYEIDEMVRCQIFFSFTKI